MLYRHCMVYINYTVSKFGYELDTNILQAGNGIDKSISFLVNPVHPYFVISIHMDQYTCKVMAA